MSNNFKILFALILIAGIGMVGYGSWPLIRKKLFTRAACPVREFATGPCATEVQTFCSDVAGYRLENCLHQNASQLSPACSKYFNPCQSFMESLCSDKPLGPLRYKCLLDSWDKLDMACQGSIKYHEECKAAKAQQK